MDLKDFRPINLASFNSQNAFVEGRQVPNLVLLANECVNPKLSANVPGLISKLDAEKA